MSRIINALGINLQGQFGTGKSVGSVTVKTSFNPILTCANPSDFAVTYANNSGTIEMLGGLALVTVKFTTATYQPNTPTSTGAIIIAGLPAPLSAVNTYTGAGWISGFTWTDILVPQIKQNGSGDAIVTFESINYATGEPNILLDVAQTLPDSTLDCQLQFIYPIL